MSEGSYKRHIVIKRNLLLRKKNYECTKVKGMQPYFEIDQKDLMNLLDEAIKIGIEDRTYSNADTIRIISEWRKKFNFKNSKSWRVLKNHDIANLIKLIKKRK